MPIVTGKALGFFAGSGNVIPFSVDLSDFSRSFSVGSKTTINYFIKDDVSSSMTFTISSKETVFLKFWPHFDIRSSPKRKIE